MGSLASSYLRATWRTAACFAALFLAMHLILYVSAPLREIWYEAGYLDLILCAMALGFYGYGFARYRSRYRRIARALEADEPLYLAVDGAGAAEDVRVLALCVGAEHKRGEAERTRLQAELLERRELLVRWAHEVKTPLSVCRLILSREGAPPALEEQLRRIEAQVQGVLHAERLRHLDQSVVMVKLDAPGLLRGAIARNARLLQARDLEIELDAPAVDAMGDERCVSYILDQLLTNAAKYAPASSSVRVFCAQAGDFAEIAAVNDGEIPPDQIRRVFDKGFSGGGEGASGMGLYYARRTADALGGRLRAESGGGETAFILALPRFQEYLRPASE